MNGKLIAFLAAGHLVVDMNQGSLPAILPHLKSAHGLSYAAAGTLVLAGNLTSSIVQPVFGYLADRRVRRWMLPLALFISGLALALTGLVNNYWLLIGLIGLMGLGVAAYHPEGFKTVTSVAGTRQTTAMSWFSLGGNLGFALGPLLTTALITDFGLYGTVGMIMPSLAAAALLLLMLPRISPGAETALLDAAKGRSMPGAMVLLLLIVIIRSWTQLGFVTFVPFYYVDHLKEAPRLVGLVLFIFLGAGALGTVAAGPLADRWGTRNFMVWGFLASVPLGVLFLNVRGGWALLVLGLFGAVLVSTFSVTIVLGQQYMPSNAGLASGLIAGFAMGAGGLGVTFLGWVADHYGLPAVLWTSALWPLPGFLAALFLPQPWQHR